VNRILDVARQKRDGIIGMESPENALVDVMIKAGLNKLQYVSFVEILAALALLTVHRHSVARVNNRSLGIGAGRNSFTLLSKKAVKRKKNSSAELGGDDDSDDVLEMVCDVVHLKAALSF
jgi:hypothetical protein